MSGSGAHGSHTRQVSVVVTVVFVIYLGQMTLNPIITPLAREVGLSEWQIGVTISTAALMLVLTSAPWGRRSQTRGRKPVLVASMLIALTAMVLFVLVAHLGMSGVLTGTVLFALFVLLRGALFGLAISAAVPTAQGYVADVTHDEQSRVSGMARIGSAQGLSMIGGSLIGGVLAGFGVMVSLTAAPVLVAAGLFLAAVVLRREPRATPIEAPVPVRAADPRLWPFLVAGFGMFTALGFIQVITGFIAQDRFGLDASTTGVGTGGALPTASTALYSLWPPLPILTGGITMLAVFAFVLLHPVCAVFPDNRRCRRGDRGNERGPGQRERPSPGRHGPGAVFADPSLTYR